MLVVIKTRGVVRSAGDRFGLSASGSSRICLKKKRNRTTDSPRGSAVMWSRPTLAGVICTSVRAVKRWHPT